jgi:hypothetical protein
MAHKRRNVVTLQRACMSLACLRDNRYWLCVYRPEMAAKDKDFLLKRQAAAQIESTANPRRCAQKHVQPLLGFPSWFSFLVLFSFLFWSIPFVKPVLKHDRQMFRRVGLVGSISESVNYRQWTSVRKTPHFEPFM